MTRRARTLFGSFGERLSAAVFADGWWFFRASDVELLTENRTSHEFETFLHRSATLARRALPDKTDLQWFRTVAPIGLQLDAAVLAAIPLVLGLVACRAHDDPTSNAPLLDLAYPFILLEEETRLRVQFSTTGPADEIQQQILVAFGQRLLWQPMAVQLTP
jgi:hypothetical protein